MLFNLWERLKMKMDEIPHNKKRVIFSLATSLWFIFLGLGLSLQWFDSKIMGISLLVVGIPMFIVSIDNYE